MFELDQYELLDFGGGRKLERFGPYVLDRPSPAAEGQAKSRPRLWESAHARYQRDVGGRGAWFPPGIVSKSWHIIHGQIALQLKLTPFGHVGVFPEQAENWEWVARQTRCAGRSLTVLNLFAYTGGGTLAAAATGAGVSHVDAARNVVAWARRNAALSRLSAAPIRWIVEDAQTFVQRELRRGRRYDAVILDPPTYGHGPKGEVWRTQQHLSPLLAACGELTSDSRQFMLLTCHAPDLGPAQLEAILAEALGEDCHPRPAAGLLTLRTCDGRELSSGAVVRWPP